MNVRMVLYTMGQVLMVFAVFLIVPLVTAAVSGETSARSLSAFLVPMIVYWRWAVCCACAAPRTPRSTPARV